MITNVNVFICLPLCKETCKKCILCKNFVFVFTLKVDNRCADSEGNKHAHGEEWDQGKCEHCLCDNGLNACTSPMCRDPPEGKRCTVRPGIENECCPQFDCEEGELVFFFPCCFDNFLTIKMRREKEINL